MYKYKRLKCQMVFRNSTELVNFFFLTTNSTKIHTNAAGFHSTTTIGKSSLLLEKKVVVNVHTFSFPNIKKKKKREKKSDTSTHSSHSHKANQPHSYFPYRQRPPIESLTINSPNHIIS